MANEAKKAQVQLNGRFGRRLNGHDVAAQLFLLKIPGWFASEISFAESADGILGGQGYATGPS